MLFDRYPDRPYNKAMSPSAWNLPLPPVFSLGGKKRFKDPLQDLSQSWALTNSSSDSQFPEVRSCSSTYPGEIILKTSYSEDAREISSASGTSPLSLLDQMGWDWISYQCHPLQELEVEVTQWIPDPRVICGIHRIHNKRAHGRELTMTLSCLDEMGLTGIHFRQETHQGRKILTGSSSDRRLALSLSGSQPQASGPTNQLSTAVLLEQNGQAQLRWVLIWSGTDVDQRNYLGEVIDLDWEGEISRRKISQANQLQIQTGNTAWDYALACSQRQARLIFEQLTLQVQEGGAVQPPLNAFQIWQLIQALKPLDTRELEWLLAYLLSGDLIQEPDFPLGAETLILALEEGIDREVGIELLSKVKLNLSSWFSELHDKDQDGIPEIPARDLFQLDRFTRGERGGDDPWLGEGCQESPALAAFLQNEIQQLIIAQERITGASPPAELLDRKLILGDFVIASWDKTEKRFRSRDYLTHTPGEGYTLPILLKNGWNPISPDLPYPSRLALHVSGISGTDQVSGLRVTFQGWDWQGHYRIEEISFRGGFWNENGCWGMTQSIFRGLDYCVVSGAKENQLLQIKALESDGDDLSLALPLWSGDHPPRYRPILIDFHLKDPARFFTHKGLRTHPARENSPVYLPLNILVLSGLLKSGRSRFAAALYQNWLETAASHVEQAGSLYSAWDPQTGQGLGKGNQLESLLPIGPLLKLLGVELHPTGELILGASPPLIFPVKLFYKGAEIILEEGETTLNRPGKPLEVFSRERGTQLQL